MGRKGWGGVERVGDGQEGVRSEGQEGAGGDRER